MTKQVLTAKVVGGQLLWNDAREAVRILSAFEGHEVSVPLSRLRKTRSYLQNRYYWGVVIELLFAAFYECGYRTTREEVHEMLKLRFLLREILSPGGEIIGHFVGSTAKLSTIEFMDYVARIQEWALETFTLIIPDPNEQLIEHDNEKSIT